MQIEQIVPNKKVKHKMYKAAIFDVGDTLVYYIPDYKQIYYDRIKKIGFSLSISALNEMVRKIYEASYNVGKKDIGIVRDTIALSYFELSNAEIKDCLKQLSEIPFPTQRMVLFDDAIPTLKKLKLKGIRLAIVSNHQARLIDELKLLGILEYFDPVIISDIVGFEKPDVRIMELALNEICEEAKYCVYIGDQSIDIKCAKEAKMDAILVDRFSITEHVEADYRIHCLNDLCNIL